jgi:hypothetical protein
VNYQLDNMIPLTGNISIVTMMLPFTKIWSRFPLNLQFRLCLVVFGHIIRNHTYLICSIKIRLLDFIVIFIFNSKYKIKLVWFGLDRMV